MEGNIEKGADISAQLAANQLANRLVAGSKPLQPGAKI